MKETISILGCGWLGLPLAEHFVKQGFEVKGSVSRSEKMEILTKKKILPYQLRITDTAIESNDLEGFLNSDILIINFPPERREDIISYHPAQIHLLINALDKSPVKQVLFISSTSVYPDLNREVFEDETSQPSKGSGKALLLAEQLFKTQPNFRTTIIRMAGLIGYDRLPGRFLAGKKNVENGGAPINVIHLDDCIGLIAEIVQQDAWGTTFNACADHHPLRKDFYTLAAKNLGLEVPLFTENATTSFKIINADKIKTRLGYTFKYPDPMTLV